ncbi:MAG: zonular occludens toxin domain-containing protein [Thiohalocapsa sp.]
MILLITGTPGAGKTLRAIHALLDYLAEGLMVFTNINGFDAPGVRPITALVDSDWRNAPEGSVVCYDECQERYPGRARAVNKVEVDPHELTQMEKHRHGNRHLVLVTQRVNLVHSGVLGLVNRHEHLKRQFGLSAVTIWWDDQVMMTRADLQAGSKMPWRHPKKLFKAYKSASGHRKDVRLPGIIKVGGLLIAAFLFYFGPKFYNGWLPIAGYPDDPKKEPEAPLLAKVQTSLAAKGTPKTATQTTQQPTAPIPSTEWWITGAMQLEGELRVVLAQNLEGRSRRIEPIDCVKRGTSIRCVVDGEIIRDKPLEPEQTRGNKTNRPLAAL